MLIYYACIVNFLYIWITNTLFMNFSLSEEHLMVRDAARDFAQTELRPGVIKRDTLQEFPDNLVKKMGALGLWASWWIQNMAEAAWIPFRMC